jgi:RNA polymerase sigma factor (sigma-70 family)
MTPKNINSATTRVLIDQRTEPPDQEANMQTNGMTMEDMREARLGVMDKLRARLGTRFAEENADDLFGQACSEYAGWLAEGRVAENPIGWLITCAWWRAINLLDRERRSPLMVSIETAFNTPDPSARTPEAAAIEADEAARIRKAIDHLPQKDGALVRLIISEGLSTREAGRKLNWRKSAAQRHYEAAQARLRVLLGDEYFVRDA